MNLISHNTNQSKPREIEITLRGSYFPELKGKVLNVKEISENTVLISYNNISAKAIRMDNPNEEEIERIIEEVVIKFI